VKKSKKERREEERMKIEQEELAKQERLAKVCIPNFVRIS